MYSPSNLQNYFMHEKEESSPCCFLMSTLSQMNHWYSPHVLITIRGWSEMIAGEGEGGSFRFLNPITYVCVYYIWGKKKMCVLHTDVFPLKKYFWPYLSPHEPLLRRPDDNFWLVPQLSVQIVCLNQNKNMHRNVMSLTLTNCDLSAWSCACLKSQRTATVKLVHTNTMKSSINYM